MEWVFEPQLYCSCPGVGTTLGCCMRPSVSGWLHPSTILQFGKWLCSHGLKKVRHRHVVFSIPKILRQHFLYDRNLPSNLIRWAWEYLKLFLQEATPQRNPIPAPSSPSRPWATCGKAAVQQRKPGWRNC